MRRTIQDYILIELQKHPDTWLNASDIAKLVNKDTARNIGYYLSRMRDDIPALEYARKSQGILYRYNSEVKA